MRALESEEQASVELSSQTHGALIELSKRSGASVEAVLDRAEDNYRRKAILDESNEMFAALHSDNLAWTEIQAERSLWEASSSNMADCE